MPTWLKQTPYYTNFTMLPTPENTVISEVIRLHMNLAPRMHRVKALIQIQQKTVIVPS